MRSERPINECIHVARTVEQCAAHRNLPPIVKLDLIVTEGCNLRCSYCFETRRTAPRSISLETARKAIDLLMLAGRSSPFVMVVFMGGEPMLRFDLVEGCVDYARRAAERASKRVSFEMTTNGTLLEEQHCRFFRDVGLRYLLSLDGAEADHDRHRVTAGKQPRGTFQAIAEKMQMLKRFQHWQGARLTVTPETATRIRGNVEKLHDLGINQFVIGFATGIPWPDEAIAGYGRGLKELYEYYLSETYGKPGCRLRIRMFELGDPLTAWRTNRRVSFGCGAGDGRLAVRPDGLYFGCSKLAAVGGFDKGVLPLGSVDEGLFHVENRLRLLDVSEGSRVKCAVCALKDACQGGCYAANYVDTGNTHLPGDDQCKLLFAQTQACDYARERLRELGMKGHQPAPAGASLKEGTDWSTT